MVETFQYTKIAKGYDNIAGLTNLEELSAGGRYFCIVNDLGAWSDGTGVLRGDGVTQDQGFASTSWAAGYLSLEQWLYLYRTILRGNRSGPVTIQTRRYDPDHWVICNAILDIGQPPTLTRPLREYHPFIYRFTRIPKQSIVEQKMYGSIYLKDGTTAQEDITTTPVLLTGWSADGESSGVTAAYASSTLTVAYGGVWRFAFHITGTKTAAQIFKFNIRVDTVEGVYQCQMAADALTQASTSMEGLLDLDAGDVLSIYVETDDVDAGTDLTPLDMQFVVESVALSS